MTCIIGLIDNERVYMGADSAAVGGYNIHSTSTPKIFKRRGGFLLGYTSSFRMGHILQHELKIPSHKKGVSVDKYIYATFAGAVRRAFKDCGYARVSNNAESGGFFLLGYKGRLFRFNADYGITESLHPFAAVGCGEYYALAAMYILTKRTLSPEYIIMQALKTAAEFSAGVRGPFNVMSV